MPKNTATQPRPKGGRPRAATAAILEALEEQLPPWEQLKQDYEAKAWAERAKNRGKNPLTGTAPEVRKGGSDAPTR